MGLKQRRKTNGRIICGRGFCKCQNREYVRGKGFMDILKNLAAPAIKLITENKDTLKSGVEAIGHIVKIGDSTKTIVEKMIKNRKPKVDNLQSIVDKMNEIKMGSGFAYI
jgi:hypothetical protein